MPVEKKIESKTLPKLRTTCLLQVPTKTILTQLSEQLGQQDVKILTLSHSLFLMSTFYKLPVL